MKMKFCYYKCWYYSFPCEASATLMALLWLTQARESPDGEKQTLCTQPPHSLYSRSNSPKGIFEPHGVGPGLSSMSLIYAEKILTTTTKKVGEVTQKCYKQEYCAPSEYWNLQWRSAEPAASSMLLGCQSRLRTVELMGFLICLLSHLWDQSST